MPPKTTMPSMAASQARASTPGVGGGSKGGLRKRAMEQADVDVDWAQPFDSSTLDVPQLSETRIVELSAALQALESEFSPDVTTTPAPQQAARQSTTQTTDKLLLEYFAVPKPGSPGKGRRRQTQQQQSSTSQQAGGASLSSPSAAAVAGTATAPERVPQAFTAAARHDLALSLRALYRKVHAGGLRAHEEVAALLNVNIAEVIHTEQVFELAGIGVVGAAKAAKVAAVNEVDSDFSSSMVLPQPPTGVAFESAAAPSTSGATSQLSVFQRATSGLPPFAVFLLRSWTTSTDALQRYFNYRQSAKDGDHDAAVAAALDVSNGPVGKGLDASGRQAALVHKLRELLRIEAEGVRNVARHDIHREVGAALHVRDMAAMSRWPGTTAVLIAAVDHIHRNLAAEYALARPSSPAGGAAADASSPASISKAKSFVDRKADDSGGSGTPSPTKSSKTLKRSPDSKLGQSSKKGGLSASDKGGEPSVPHMCCSHVLSYPDAASAQVAMERAVAAFGPDGTAAPNVVVDAPLLLPFTVSSSEPTILPLQRPAGYVQPNLEQNEMRVARGKAEKAHILCDGYDRSVPQASKITIIVHAPAESIVPLAAFGFGALEPQRRGTSTSSQLPGTALSRSMSNDAAAVGDADSAEAAAANMSRLRRRQSMVRRRSVTPGSLIELQAANSGAKMTPAVFPTKTTIRLESFDIESQKFVFRVAATRPQGEPSDLKLFCESVLSDAAKADQVGSKMHNRLALRFVRPHHCKRHTEQRFAFFCRTCRAFICRSCRAERHAHHDCSPHSSFCADEVARLGPKRDVVLHRLDALRRLREGLSADEMRMHDVVDAAINDVRSRLSARHKALQEDANARVAKFTKEVDAELDVWRTELEVTRATLKKIAEAKAGRITALEASAQPTASSIRDSFSGLRVPAKELQLMATVLTWSNPSQYLTSAIYPSADDHDFLVAAGLAQPRRDQR